MKNVIHKMFYEIPEICSECEFCCTKIVKHNDMLFYKFAPLPKFLFTPPPKEHLFEEKITKDKKNAFCKERQKFINTNDYSCGIKHLRGMEEEEVN